MSRSLPLELLRTAPLPCMAAALLACGTTTTTPAPRPGAAEMQAQPPESFAFPPPSRVHFSWTERRRFEATLTPAAGGQAAGEPRERDESELRWDVSMHPSVNDTTVVDERLVHVTIAHDGRTIVDGAPAAADVQVVLDAGGNVQEVRGADAASDAVRALAPPEAGGRGAPMLSAEGLRAIVTSRHDLFVGDVVGRPAQPGATWIVPRKPGGNALLRRYTVERPEACDGRGCSRLRVHIELDPQALEPLAARLVARRAAERDGAREPVSVERARYAMDGALLVDAAGLLPHGATLTEAAHATLAGAGRAFVLDVRATTEDRYDYETPAAGAVSRGD
ncbi:MAG TPA: hypothetical protein VE987_10940 [Polyangiaceae bacterium]|nr:hypothetical protein [Polyangiaceae bacterium]